MSSMENQNQLALNAQSVLDLISKAGNQIDKVQALLKLLEIIELEITIAGDKQKILNIELITEYPNVQYTKTLTKNETWRRTLQQVIHSKDINEEKIVGTMDTQFMLKMISHRRKRAQEIVNALKNEVAGTEVIPSKTRTKKFFGMV